ncbi:MAG: energy transducer TonB [Desulfomicrobium sp.]|nr:energy transducer TonB [Desulfomicrobium sp.]NLW04893.1 TonB family protein [Pseudomonadaceae bacterium]
MSDTERWTAAIILALSAHFFILQADWKKDSLGISGQMVQVRLSQSRVRIGDGPGVDIVSGGSESSDEARLADERRKIYNRYMDDIGAAIHSRRFAYGREDLIGMAVFSFIVDYSGAFRQIKMLSSSGDSELDKAASHAVHLASATVKRPAELGKEPIAVILPVKYQYGLN